MATVTKYTPPSHLREVRFGSKLSFVRTEAKFTRGPKGNFIPDHKNDHHIYRYDFIPRIHGRVSDKEGTELLLTRKDIEEKIAKEIFEEYDPELEESEQDFNYR